MTRTGNDQLLLGEWACLGIIAVRRTHGFDVARRLAPEGDIGRVWSLSRSLTYRAIDQLADRGFIEAVGVEPGRAGGSRTIYAATRTGRARLRRWLTTPVEHLRDLRSELLLKLLIADGTGVDVADMLTRQRRHIAQLCDAIDRVAGENPHDVVALWRQESSHAARRFLDRLPA